MTQETVFASKEETPEKWETSVKSTGYETETVAVTAPTEKTRPTGGRRWRRWHSGVIVLQSRRCFVAVLSGK